VTSRMFNPPHPGKVLRDALGDMDVTTVAKRLHMSRTTLSRILNGASRISADMSLRLSAALGTHDSMWYEMQMSYDIWHASRKKRPKIERFDVAA
jgi:antitoxin HigA-1